MKEITDQLFISNANKVKDEKLMRKHNIGCVVNATGNIPFPVWKNDLKKVRGLSKGLG